MISHLELMGRLLLAAPPGSVVGIGRERLNRAAGLRTHVLVCVGASLAMPVSIVGLPGAGSILAGVEPLEPSVGSLA